MRIWICDTEKTTTTTTSLGKINKNEKHEIIPSTLEIHSEKVKDMMVQNVGFRIFTYTD